MATKANGGKASQPAKQEKQKPAAEFRMGRIRCTVWANQHEQRGTWYSMTLTRSYKDGDQWKTATSFGADDLLVIGEVCRRARWWIQEQYTKGSQSNAGQEEVATAGSEDIPF
jgi:hypothetical protein